MEFATARSAAQAAPVEDRHDGTVTFGHKYDYWVALFVILVSGVIYHMTAGRGAPFWDCGEFIACAYILGIPHPPGAALFVIVGRVVSLIPFGDTAFILNLFSAYCSALAVGFFALSIARVIRRINGLDRTFDDRLAVWGGAILGSLMVAFGSTCWFNAVEAEVYGLTILLVAILIWLTMIWLEKARTPEGNRILLLQTYILFLAATNHMQAFLPIIPLFLLIFLTDRRRLRSPFFYVIFLMLTTVIWWTDGFLIGVPLCCAGFLLLAFLSTGRELRKSFLLASMFLFLAVSGYSIYGYVPIRSAQNPAIDENNPETWANFKMFLERKQYSDKSMVELMFTRKGTFTNQFGTFHRIGFWGHLINQWVPKPKHVYLIIPIIVLFGLWAMWKKDRKIFLYYLVSLMLFTVAMTLYLNFSDGTKGVKLEVRDRDYFYTPGFVMIGFIFGVGAGALLGFLRRVFGVGGAFMSRLALILMFILPPAAVRANYFTHDRSRFWVAEDLAHNMLEPLRENAIIFTGGDNDTFPLWYAQEVRGTRKDVRIINLSLLNTGWYILQLKHQDPKINISMSDDEISGLRGYYKPEGGVVTVKDIMVPIIIRENHEERPIYFAITVPGSDREIVKDKLLQEGLVVRLEPGLTQESFDIKQMEANFSGRYRFRGLDDPTVYKDRDAIRLLTNYNACLFNLAQLFLRSDEPEKAQKYIDMIASFPHDNPAGYRMLTALAEMTEDWNGALKYIDGAIAKAPTDAQNYVRRAEYLRRLGRREEAIASIQEAQIRFPDNGTLKRALASFPADGKDVPPPPPPN